MALAKKGLHGEFTANYRTVVNGSHDLLLMTVTAAQVSWPLSSDAEVSPHLMYEESVAGSLSEVFWGALQSSRSNPGFYTCNRNLAWTCSVVGLGTEGSMLLDAYLPSLVVLPRGQRRVRAASQSDRPARRVRRFKLEVPSLCGVGERQHHRPTPLPVGSAGRSGLADVSH